MRTSVPSNDIELPPSTHVTTLTGIDVVTGEDLSYTVVWADRPYHDCPRCYEPVGETVDGCPAYLNTGAGAGGTLQDQSPQHGCGLRLAVDWTHVEPASDEAVLGAAEELAQRRTGAVDDRMKAIEQELRTQLAAALARLAEPLMDGETVDDREYEVRTGGDATPGIYRDSDGTWLAWDYSPVDAETTVTVFDTDLVGDSSAGS
jgi:hypothetical protein